jgi:hypothetical protein
MNMQNIEQTLLVSNFLADKGMPHYMVRRSVGSLGKVLREEYVKEHGHDPKLVERWIGGEKRWVAHYTVSDKPLFDRAYALWRAMS